MRKFNIIFCLFIFSLSIGNLNAQQDFKGGILAGPVTTQISGDGLGGWDKFGFTAGGWVNMPISEKSGVMLSIKYINKGSRTKIDTINFQTFSFNLNYIDVPILYSYKFNLKKSNLMFTVGPYVGVLLNQKIISNFNEFPVGNPEFERFDIGAQAGIQWWLGQKFFVDLSGSSSVIPTRPAPLVVNKTSFYEKGNYNQTLQLMLGLAF